MVVEIAEQVSQYLAHGTILNAVNVPSVSREAAAKLGPYLELARKLGAFLAQVGPIPPKAIEVECAGEPADLGPKSITNAAVAGLLARFLSAPVNQVRRRLSSRPTGESRFESSGARPRGATRTWSRWRMRGDGDKRRRGAGHGRQRRGGPADAGGAATTRARRGAR